MPLWGLAGGPLGGDWTPQEGLGLLIRETDPPTERHVPPPREDTARRRVCTFVLDPQRLELRETNVRLLKVTRSMVSCHSSLHRPRHPPPRKAFGSGEACPPREAAESGEHGTGHTGWVRTPAPASQPCDRGTALEPP